MAARALELLRRYAPQQFQSASWSAEAYLLLIFEQKVSTEIDNFNPILEGWYETY